MRTNNIFIINNTLHKFKYLLFTITFYVIIFYGCYNSFLIHLPNKNYMWLLFCFIGIIALYIYFYKNFSFIIGFIMLIVFTIYDNSINKKVIEGNDFPSIMKSIEKESNDKGDRMEADAKKKKPPRNPCKSYIINRLQAAGINISNNSHNSDGAKGSTNSKMDDILSGHDDLVAPKIYRL